MPLILRPWTPRDAAAVFAAYQDPAMESQGGTMAEEEAARVWCTARAHPDPSSGWVELCAELDGEVAGNVGISSVNFTHGTGWVYYWTAPELRGRGVASRALAGLARWAFEEQQLFRLELGHRVNNPASCAVAAAAGFVAEGIERAKLEYDGVRYDVETHARLRTDPAPGIEPAPVHL